MQGSMTVFCFWNTHRTQTWMFEEHMSVERWRVKLGSKIIYLSTLCVLESVIDVSGGDFRACDGDFVELRKNNRRKKRYNRGSQLVS